MVGSLSNFSFYYFEQKNILLFRWLSFISLEGIQLGRRLNFLTGDASADDLLGDGHLAALHQDGGPAESPRATCAPHAPHVLAGLLREIEKHHMINL